MALEPMEQFQHISVQETFDKLASDAVRVVDIRDETAFTQGRIPNAYHLTNGTMSEFVQQVDVETPVVVCCYHGISSQQAAQYLIHQGFEQVYSMDGGFEAWRAQYAVESGE